MSVFVRQFESAISAFPGNDRLTRVRFPSGSGNNSAMARLELFLFRYRDARTGRWTLSRYRAERHEIAARYAEFELIGAPEIREIDEERQRFSPHVGVEQRPDLAPQRRPQDRDSATDVVPLVDPRTVRGPERALLVLFLAGPLSPALRDLLREAAEVCGNERRRPPARRNSRAVARR
jgi:hypothetical protein